MKTNFNFNSQICTSRSQSKRLLALGLKKETADMSNDGWNDPVVSWGMEWSKEIIESGRLPAWSLHRLMVMAFNSLNDADADAEDEIYFIRQKNPFESMLELFEWLIKEGYFNKEYLV